MSAIGVGAVAESYQKFNPRAYLQNNYMPPRANFTSEEFAVPWKLRCLADAFATGKICGHTLIDIGTGPTIYQLLSACDYFEEIVATDYLEVNRAEIQSWVRSEDSGCFDWSPYIQHTCRIEGKGEPWKEKEQKLKKKLKKVLPIDVHQPNPLGSSLSQPADALISAFCLEAVSPDRLSFDRALWNVTTLLKPDGHFLMIGALDESFYLAGEAKLLVVPMSEVDVKESFAKSGYRIHDFRSYIMPPSLKIGVDDVQGIFFIHAQKIA
ncbi:phenylethanolamine N-methyltransferase [Rhineura floridana]|uniref:phenylethanolamine N-methyltransferase n=1 Tax=Rhineura floridana TaxID=261503 RepID=UPI002AC8820A|nr:phenylethanolamine N-methyltransferase [Rhineura floridana]